MTNIEIKDFILKGVRILKDQPYAMYFKDGDIEFYSMLQNYPGNGLDTNFRLASVTKQFIAAGIISLVNDNKLSYDTCVRDLFNELPEYFNDIKLINLLNHTSGIYDYEDMPHNEDDPQILDEGIIPFLCSTDKTYFEIGTEYKYSNTAYVLLALIIKKVSGQSIGDYLLENVFKKANMFDTVANYQGITNVNNRAYGHSIIDGKMVETDQYWCSATIGDGGIYSNIYDLKNWIDYLLNNHEFYKENMFKPNILPNGKNSEYGMGMRIIKSGENTIYYHCGSTIGTNTIILFSNDLDIKCIFLTNLGYTETALVKDNILEYLKNK